jgi:signal transduction histidine kinase/HAMP domain-containing protein
MRRLPLSAWLGFLNAGVVLLVTGALAPAALTLFERLAAENARSRVQLAALGAVEAIEGEAAAVATAADLLAERPTLLRLTAARDGEALARFLERFRGTGRLAGAAVLRGEEIVAASPANLPWVEIDRRTSPGAGFLPPLRGGAEPLATGRAGLSGIPGAHAIVFRRLDASFAQELSRQMGLTVTIGSPGRGGASAAPDGYRGRARVRNAVDVEASLPRSEVARAVTPLRRTFVLVTIAACLLAVGAGAVAGRRLAHPLAAMRRAAARIGSGDLATPVPPAAGAEMAALTSTLDEMRQRLRSLTGELRHREAEAQALLSGIVEGVFAVDGDRRIQYLNEQAGKLLGIDANDAVGRFCGDVLRPASFDGVRPCEERCPIVHARSRGTSRAVEHLELAGGRRTVVLTSSPPSDARQVQVLRDETETEAAGRSRDAVLANVSHELKTPLSAQLASIELLRDGLRILEPAAAEELVTSLERSTLRLVRLVDNLLESVRIETGQASFRRVPVELDTLVGEAAAMTRPLFDQRRQRLDFEPLGPLPPLSGDPGQLTQVLVNLLANAHKYAPDGSTIRVGGSFDEDAITLWVEDAGPGVPPALSASIFDRFQRAGTDGQGMGLGLWIAKSIVERHGGRIAVSSSPEGGARFTLEFPVHEAAA